MNPMMATMNNIPSQPAESEANDISGLKIVVSGYYGFDNLGDELILQTLIQYARARGCEITVLSQNPQRTTEQYGVPAIKRTNLAQVFNNFRQSHLLISGGGGLFQDSTGPASPFYYGGLILLADYLRLPVMVWGQGVGPLNHSVSRLMTRWAFSKARQILVRDEKSQHLIQDLFENEIDRPVTLTADPVWLWQPEPFNNHAEKIQPTGIRVGVSLRVWPSLQETGINALAKALLIWVQRAQAQAPDLPVEMLLMPFQEAQDVPVLKQLAAALNHLDPQITISWLSPQDVVQSLPSLNFLVAMRFHALLLGLTQNRFPLFAIAYDPKVKALAEQCGVPYALPENLDELPASAFESCFATVSDLSEAGRYPAVIHQKSQASFNTACLDALLSTIQAELLGGAQV